MSFSPTTTTPPSQKPSDSPTLADNGSKGIVTSLQMAVARSQASSDDSNASAPSQPSIQTPNTSQQESPMIPLQPQTSPGQKGDRPYWSFGPAFHAAASRPSPTHSEEADQQERTGQGPLDASYLPTTGQWSPLQSRLGGFQQQQQQQRGPLDDARYGGAAKTQYATDGDAGQASRDYQRHHDSWNSSRPAWSQDAEPSWQDKHYPSTSEQNQSSNQRYSASGLPRGQVGDFVDGALDWQGTRRIDAARRTGPIDFVHSSPTSIDYSVLVGGLDPSVREADLLRFFLDPPAWPAHHPLALASDRERHHSYLSAAPAPAPFLSTKSAKVIADPSTAGAAPQGLGLVKFSDEDDAARALDELPGMYLQLPGSTYSPRPLRISPTSSKMRGSYATSPVLHRDEYHDQELQQQQQYHHSHGSLGSVDAASLAGRIGSKARTSPAITAPSAGRYSTPSPAEIAMQSASIPTLPSWGGVPTLPGFPTIPATGVSGPVDVGLHGGVALGSSYGGPASLAGTGFTLGPSTLPSPSSALDPNNTTVFVGGLSSLISEDTLKTFFSPFGAIAYVKIPPGKGCGFVSFVRKVDAERAIERMQGFPVGGCRIRLSWGRSQGEKNQQLAQQQLVNLSQLASLAGLGNISGLASLQPQQLVQLASVREAISEQTASGRHGSGPHHQSKSPIDRHSEFTQDSLRRYGDPASLQEPSHQHDLLYDAVRPRENQLLQHQHQQQDRSSPLYSPAASARARDHFLTQDSTPYSNGERDISALFDRMDLGRQTADDGRDDPWARHGALYRRQSGEQTTTSTRLYQGPSPTAAVFRPRSAAVQPNSTPRSSRPSPETQQDFHLPEPWLIEGGSRAPSSGQQGSYGRSRTGGGTHKSSAFSPFSPLIKADGDLPT